VRQDVRFCWTGPPTNIIRAQYRRVSTRWSAPPGGFGGYSTKRQAETVFEDLHGHLSFFEIHSVTLINLLAWDQDNRAAYPTRLICNQICTSLTRIDFWIFDKSAGIQYEKPALDGPCCNIMADVKTSLRNQ
jgi:hypothetical protein